MGALLGLLALVLFLFRETVLFGRVFYERDVHLVWQAQALAFFRAVSSGSWPLWDNSIAFGRPLLADPSAQVLYPFTWLHLLMVPATYYTVFVVSHFLLSGAGMYYLGKRLGLSPLGAFAAAALWVASGPFLSLVSLWHHLAGAAWIPWVFLTADEAFASRKALPALAWGAVVAVQILAGSADMVAMTGLLVMANGLRYVNWRTLRDPENARLVARGLIALGVALGLSAAQWLVTLETARRSARWGLDPGVRTGWSVHPLGMVQSIFPLLLEGYVEQPEVRAILFESREPFLRSLYLGMASLGLVGVALAMPVRPRRWLLVATVLVALFMALGRHGVLYELALWLLPPLRILRFPVKAMVIGAFAWSLLAGMGLEAWRSTPPRRWALFVLAPMATAATLGFSLLFLVEAWRPAWLREGLVSAFAQALRPSMASLGVAAAACTALLGLAVLSRTARFSSSWMVPAVVCLLAIGDLATAHRSFNLTAPRTLYAFRPAVLATFENQDVQRLYVYEYYFTPGKSLRYLGRPDAYPVTRSGDPSDTLTPAIALRSYLFPPLPAVFGLDSSFDIDIRGLYPAYLADITQFLRVSEGTPVHLRLLQMGAVSHVLALHTEGFEDLLSLAAVPSLFPEPIRVFRVPGTLPRAYAVGAAHAADDRAAFAILVSPAFDPRREVIVAEGPAVEAPPSFSGTVRLVSREPDRVRIGAVLSQPGFVVLTDGYDPAWRATVDGNEAEVLRANLAFRAVRVPAGSHVVELVYRPKTLLCGLATSALTLLALAAGAALAASRTRSRRQATAGASVTIR